MNITSDLFSLLALGLYNEIKKTDFSDINWHKLIELSIKHGVVGQVFYAVKRLKDGEIEDGKINIDSLDLGQLYTITTKQEKYFLEMWDQTLKLADLFSSNNIRTVVIKGFGIASLYPNPKARLFCDLDCFLLSKDHNNIDNHDDVWHNANSLIKSQGVKLNTDVYLHSTFEYKKLHVENHRYMTNVKGSKRMLEFENYLQNSLLIEGTTNIGNTKVEIPNLMFTSLYVLYHSHKHMLHGEMTLRMLCDWAVILKESTQREFRWEEFWDVCHKFGLYRFAVAMTSLAQNICCSPLPQGFKKDNDVGAILLNYIMNPVSQVNHYSSKWLARLNHLYLTFKARERYREFSDMTSFQATIDIIKGRFIDE